MEIEKSVIEDVNFIEKEAVPHLIKYMGSKRNILKYVSNSIDEIRVSNKQNLLDLFAGSAVLSGAFREKMPVTCNDIQSYSKILGNIYLQNYFWEEVEDNIIDQILEEIQEHIFQFGLKYDLGLNYNDCQTFSDVLKIENREKELIKYPFNGLPHLFAKNFSGTYWSYEQCVAIDAIASIARKEKFANTFLEDLILGSLMFAMAYCSQSTGHYAQYRVVKEENFKDMLVYRRKDLVQIFEKKIRSLKEFFDGSNNTDFEHKLTTEDYKVSLDNMNIGSIVYADPPYQFVHYSRFYHVLETLAKYDYPTLKFKGRYRTDRHQSPFCIKTKVKGAFTDLFKGVVKKDSSLVLSYSNSGMISLEEIVNLGEKVFKKYELEIKELNHIHSTMGRFGDKSRDVKEFLLVFKK